MTQRVLFTSKYLKDKPVAYLVYEGKDVRLVRLPCCTIGMFFEVLSKLIDMDIHCKV